MDFGKIFLILKREYLTRIRTKSFILSTVLTPIGLVGLMALSIYVSLPKEDNASKQVGIIDHTDLLFNELTAIDSNRYTDVSALPIDSVKALVLAEELDAYLELDEANIDNTEPVTLVYGGSGGLGFLDSVEDDLRQAFRNVRIKQSQVSDEVRTIFETRYRINSVKLTEEGEQQDHAVFGAVFGFVLGLLIFMGVFGYGAVLMRSVIEEKTNRIVEVITSSVKPIELMMGKLLGICLLAITQFGLWIVCYIGISVAAAPIAGIIVNQQMQKVPEEAREAASSFDPASLEQFVVDPMVFVYFFLFFIIGFLIYAALFAAIGAAADNEQDTQQFMLPVMLPIFMGYMLNMRVMQNPDSAVSVISSLFPLTAPINMITRIASSEVPFYEIILSLALMVATFMGLMWLAAKIYRIGILMYGKKPSYKELLKWIRMG